MKIVICGGGTAGWLAALMISTLQKGKHEVVVVDSTRVGIVGVGEASTGFLTHIIKGTDVDYGCDEDEFIREADVTVKLGIVHKDWYKKGTSFKEPIDGMVSGNGRHNTLLYHCILNDLPLHDMSRIGYFMDRGKVPFRMKDGKYNSENAGSAIHFDAYKVGQYFKKVCLRNGNVKHIDADILDVVQDDYGICHLNVSGNRTITGDFFIDSTGFSRVLMKSLGVKWTSYRNHLPVNTAMPFVINYKENETVDPTSLAQALSSGWRWRIPTASRYGSGYVYDDRFISDEQAKQELEAVVGHEIRPVQLLKFDTGRFEKFWYKNCLAIGLCGAFMEPLSATSIHATIIQLNKFIFGYLQKTKEKTINIGSQNTYNKDTATMYDCFKDFTVFNYQTKRDDSEFWRWIATGETRTEFVQNLMDISKTGTCKHHHFPTFYGSAGEGVWNWIFCGLGYTTKENVMHELETSNLTLENIKQDYDNHIAERERYINNDNWLTNNDFIKGR